MTLDFHEQDSPCKPTLFKAQNLAISAAKKLSDYITYFNQSMGSSETIDDKKDDVIEVCSNNQCKNAINVILSAISGTDADSAYLGCNLMETLYAATPLDFS